MSYTHICEFLAEQYAIIPRAIALLSHSDKMVYRVSAKDAVYIFDIYRRREELASAVNGDHGKYTTEQAIASEIRILNILANHCPELKTPSPIKACDGRTQTTIILDGQPATCLLRPFIPGTELIKSHPDYLQHANQAGAVAAKLHNASNQYLAGEYDQRPEHRQAYVQQIIHTIQQGLQAGTITGDQFALIRRALELVIQRMDQMDRCPDYLGIVHTDLRDANFLVAGDAVVPIDFGRCVYGYLLYDLGEMCAHMGGSHRQVPPEIIKGYHSVRPLSTADLVTIEAMMMLFILSVVAEKILHRGSSYVLQTVKRLTEGDLVHLLAGEPVIAGIREVIQQKCPEQL